MLKKIFWLLWFISIIGFLFGWFFGFIKSGSFSLLWLALICPLIMLFSSLIIFSSLPSGWRLIHYLVVIPTIVIAPSSMFYTLFYGGAQGGVGLIIIAGLTGFIYLIFISLLLLSLYVYNLVSGVKNA